MNIETGEIRNLDSKSFQALEKEEQAKYVPVKRDLTHKESSDMQIKKYSPCGCGSGKKFKFCCFQKK